MSYVQEELAEEGQTVLAAIVSHEDDARIRRALIVTPSISFYGYQVGRNHEVGAVRVVLLAADRHSHGPDFVLDGTQERRSNPSHAKSWLVRLNPANRKPPSKPVLAFHPNGHRRRLPGNTGVLGCTAAAVLSFLFSVVSGHAIVAAFVLLFYYFGGVGVRERSLYAAGVVLILFAEDTLASGLGVARVLIGALLLSNLRATWIASHWQPGAEESILPPRLVC